MQSFEIQPGTMFNPKFANIGNENDLCRRLKKGKAKTGVVKNAFVYHFKGFTVNQGRRGGRDAINESDFVFGDGPL